MAKRLFLGLELPEVSRQTLAELDPHISGLRWLPSEQLHLTMSFLGDVEPEAQERLGEVLNPVRVPSFFLPIEGVGAFGGNRPTVVWAGVGNGHPHLSALHKHLQDAVLRAGLEADLRPFHPHITLARAKNVARSTLKPFLIKYAETEFDFWKVTGFALFSSNLTSEGAQYTVELRREF